MTEATDIYTLFPMLPSFEAAVRDDPAVLGVLYTGSLGPGACDRFSDLDIVVWVPDLPTARSTERFHEMLSRLGDVHFWYQRGAELVTGFVGPEWRRTDLYLLRKEELKPEAEYAGARVVKDRDGFLAQLVRESPPEELRTTLEQAKAAIEEAIDSQIYLALHNARGAVWSAMGEVSYRCAELYTFLARLRGRNSYGFRYVETLLSPVEQRLLTACWPAAPTRDEVRRAGRALWDWTRYLWAEVERALGSPLDVTIDEAGLLAAVDRIYTW